MKIPLHNLYYLLCYAWDVPGLRGQSPTLPEEAALPRDLLASMLVESVSGLLRRGVDRGYVERQEDTARPRGKFLLRDTVSRNLLPLGKACCVYDELSQDVLHNRVLRSALSLLLNARGLAPSLRRQVSDLVRRFPAVTPLPLTPAAFRRLQLHRNNASYVLPLHVCRLLATNAVPEANAGGTRIQDFRGDERQMGILFEAFVRNFLRRELTTTKVHRENVTWNAVGEKADVALLPRMQTDISLSHASERVIIETKFCDPYVAHYGTRKLRSDHLAQLFVYLTNLAHPPGDTRPTSGLLLYPTLGSTLRRRYELCGQRIDVRSVDLAGPWPTIKSGLLEVVKLELEVLTPSAAY